MGDSPLITTLIVAAIGSPVIVELIRVTANGGKGKRLWRKVSILWMEWAGNVRRGSAERDLDTSWWPDEPDMPD